MSGVLRSPDVSVPGLDTAIGKIGLHVIRGAAVGVSCGVLPVACPAILALSQAAGFAKVVSDVYDAYARSSTHRRGLERAAVEAGRAAISTTIGNAIRDGNETEIRTVSAAVGTAMGTAASGALGVDPGLVRAIASETTYRAMAGGVDGIVSWGVEGLGRSS